MPVTTSLAAQRAVLKQENLRSRRLLERLGFTPASPQQHAQRQVESGELLMLLEI